MMTDEQIEFFTLLTAPFADHDVKPLNKSGRTLHYITARTVMNRLDDVCGVTGWFPTYRSNEKGLSCTLHLNVPMPDGEYGWMHKEDGGGFAAMASDEDNEKSGYSDALKRAAVAWGVGRYLYRDGTPAYMGHVEPVPERHTGPVPAARPSAPPRSAPPQTGGGHQASGYQGDRFAPPRGCRGVYPWLKNLEEHFGGGVLKVSNAVAKEAGFPWKSNEWDDFMVETVTWSLIDEIKTWDKYQGEFEHLKDPRAGE